MDKIEEDFEYELTCNRIPDPECDGLIAYRDIIVSNAEILNAVFQEFIALKPKPKAHLYFKEFISDSEWAEMVSVSETTYGRQLYDEFYRKKIDGELEEKYYGRQIIETKTVRLLNGIHSDIELFKKYVMRDDNINNYHLFAEVTVGSMIAKASQLDIFNMRLSVLTQFLNDNNNIHLTLYTFDKPDLGIKDNYEILKRHADNLIRDELRNIQTNFSLISKENNNLVNQPQELKPERPLESSRLLMELEINRLNKFLESKSFTSKAANEIMDAISAGETPFRVALLYKLGFIDYIKKEYCQGKAKERDVLLSKILNVPCRRIKGNINVLNPNSLEDRIKYTSHLHIENVNELIRRL